ncbi:low-density lipoprotein receptor-related protein 6-like [Antedon mediterranea]|uniref:low-density lipoprotein receptor-related protein 6-like n=1 Tax=Antedon mediterranea TaxID=105859 RepID=UPI003AF6C471
MFVTNIGPVGIYISKSDSSYLSFTPVGMENVQLVDPWELDYDDTTSTLYWYDDGKMSIERYSFDTNQHDVLFSFIYYVRLAVDGPGKKLYLTLDVGNTRRVIGVINLDGIDLRTLIDTGLIYPYAIAIDTTNGYLYWTDAELERIERVKLNDLSTRTALVTTGLSYPTGLVLAVPDGKMYWCGYKKRMIGEANLDGSNRRTITLSEKARPYNIDIYRNYLYWTDYGGDIYRVDRKTGISSNQTSDSRLNTPHGLYIFKSKYSKLKYLNEIAVN